MKEFMKDELYIPRYDVELREEREIAYHRLKRVCCAGFADVTDFRCAFCVCFGTGSVQKLGEMRTL